MFDKHEHFRKRLKNSHPAVVVVVKWLNQFGIAHADEPECAPSVKEKDDYIDNGDIYFTRHPEQPWQKVEVKQQFRQWAGKEDFPFPEVTVVACDRFEYTTPKTAVAYVIVNKDMTVGAVVPVKATREHWIKKPTYDRERDEWYDAWYCPIMKDEQQLVHFYSLTVKETP